MFKPNTINFTIEGVAGNLSIVAGVLGQPKVYQDGVELRKEGIFVPKYRVKTDDGQGDLITVKQDMSFAICVVFRGKKTKLEENLSVIEYIIGAVPLIVLIPLGGVVGAIIGALGLTLLYNYMRIEKRLPMQILVTVVVCVVCWVIYLAIAYLVYSVL